MEENASPGEWWRGNLERVLGPVKLRPASGATHVEHASLLQALASLQITHKVAGWCRLWQSRPDNGMVLDLGEIILKEQGSVCLQIMSPRCLAK